MANPDGGVTWTVRHDVVLITTKEKARGKPIIVNHDVQDIIFGLTDFLGPRINQLRMLDKMTDEDGGGPFGAVLEKKKMIEPADLATLIQENVAVGTWQEEGVSIDVHEGYILINHVPEVQEQVRQFLEDLRRFSSSLVTIESEVHDRRPELAARRSGSTSAASTTRPSATSRTASRTWRAAVSTTAGRHERQQRERSPLGRLLLRQRC
jgi:hypothetical protein